MKYRIEECEVCGIMNPTLVKNIQYIKYTYVMMN